MSIDAHDLRAGPELVQRVRRMLRGAPAEQREAAVEHWADALAGEEHGPRLIALLAAEPEPDMRHLAVRLAARRPPPAEPSTRSMLRHLLLDRRVPESALLDLAGVLLKSVVDNEPEKTDILQALVAGLGKAQKAERLRLLEGIAGRSPALAAYRAQIDQKLKLLCPRCSVELPRAQMIKHIWLEHRLLMDGQSVREPWRLIDEWIEDYSLDHNPELLARCRALARRIDPQEGLLRVHQLFLEKHIGDDEAKASVRQEAVLQHASVCPHCYALVPAPQEAELKPLHVSGESISAYGYRVELSENRLMTRLEVEAPDRFVYAGPEPGRRLTPRGGTFLLAGPVLVAALLVAVTAAAHGQSALLAVGLLLAAAVVLTLVARLIWAPRRERLDRLIDYAWAVLVPRMHADGFVVEDSHFLARLALTSLGRGRPRARAGPLLRLLTVTEKAVADGSVSAAHLGAFWRLAVADAAGAGVDPVRFVAAQALRCFEEKVPLAFAEALLAGWTGAGVDPADRARLRVVLCDRAFESGCEVRDLIELGRAAPALGELLDIDHPYCLAQLRLLWSLRATLPWSKCGAAANAFELAANVEAGRKHLGKHPDLLLAAWDIPGGYVGTQGLYFHDVLFTEPPRTKEIKARSFFHGGGFELRLGPQRFWFQMNPALLLDEVERWFRYYFRDFRPRVADVYSWPSYAKLDNLRRDQVARCPDCKRELRVRVGEVGISEG